MKDDGSLKIRKRRPGGGRKPSSAKLVARQFYLEQWQAGALKDAAQASYMSQSEWLRRLLYENLYG